MDDNQYNKLESKIDKIVDKQTEMAIILSAQHESLKTHIKRTDLLEKALEPIKKHVNMVSGGLKLLGIIAIIFEIMRVIKG